MIPFYPLSKAALAAGFAGLLAQVPCIAQPALPKIAPIPYTVPRPATVQSGNAGKKLNDDMECLVEPHLITSLGSPVEGTLSEVLVDRGASVTKGQVVARLNSMVEAASVNLKTAQEEFGKR